MPRIAEHGSWLSPVTSDLVASESVRLGEPRIADGAVYWLEGRPAERGRTALVRRGPDGATGDALPSACNVRSGVHEYGGGAYAVLGETAYFSEHRDRRLYRARPAQEPEPLTPEGRWRYADLEIDVRRNRLLAVCEDHSDPAREPLQSLVAVPLDGRESAPGPLRAGADFYSNPRLSPDGGSLGWLEWRHPDMPWDGTELWTAEVSRDGALREPRKVAGGPGESIFQPQWSPTGALHFVSDRDGFWNLYRHEAGGAVPLHPRAAEFGLPQWLFGMSTYGFTDDGRILAAYCESGVWRLGCLDTDGNLEPVAAPYTSIDGVAVRGRSAVFRAAGPRELPAIVRLDCDSGELEILRRSAELDPALQPYLSPARSVSFQSAAGETVHAFHYAPRNPDFAAPEGQKPPLIVRAHGGPTGASGDGLSLATQFWTSRGFAVADVNYGGSTGYGRAYRERLNGRWGEVDVEDTVAAARHFVEAGLADPARLIVKGGSAGGYTALCCLAFRDEFAAGASYYGIGDLAALARETHKFESRYHETLVGPWPAAQALYAARSPLLAADRLTAPAIFFQGSEDRVVPPGQAEAMVEALRARNVPAAYFLFEGEGHGFRDGANIRRALDGELCFYAATVLRKGLRF